MTQRRAAQDSPSATILPDVTDAPGETEGGNTESPPSRPNTPGRAPSIPLPTAIRARRRPLAVEETSAGGLILNDLSDQAQAALIGRIDRRGRIMWSLPKGHLEAGESARQAAVREVEEETGIKGEILTELGTIDFWFVADGQRIHKTVHHFLLRKIGGTVNADDPEVVAVEWVPLGELSARLAYADERRLMQLVPELLAQHR